MNGDISIGSVPLCQNGTINCNVKQRTRAMDILARRLTIISLLMTIFAVSMIAAVQADTARRNQTRFAIMSECSADTNANCYKSL